MSCGASPAVFASFRASRFKFSAADTPPPVEEWLRTLPAADHKKRFHARHIEAAIPAVEQRTNETLQALRTDPETCKSRVADHVGALYAGRRQTPPEALIDQIKGLQVSAGVEQQHVFTICVYSLELYEDGNAERKVPCQFQIYRCRCRCNAALGDGARFAVP